MSPTSSVVAEQAGHRAPVEPSSAKQRRAPKQARSRERVARILEAAAVEVLAGPDTVSARDIAERADVAIASLYQYFADKDDIIAAVFESDLERLDERICSRVRSLPGREVADVVAAVLSAATESIAEQPSLRTLWLDGRTLPGVRQLIDEYHQQLARAMVKGAGRSSSVAGDSHARIAVLMADRLLQVAFEQDPAGDPLILAETQRVVTDYLQGFAEGRGTPAV